MAEAIISRGSSALIDFVQLTDAEGRLVMLPAAMCDHFRAAGQTSLTLVVSLCPGIAPREWMTVTEAAQRLADELAISLDTAKTRVSRACTDEEINSRGKSNLRRIDPNSFDAWLLRARDRANARDERLNG